MDISDRIREFVWGNESYESMTAEQDEDSDNVDYVQSHLSDVLNFLCVWVCVYQFDWFVGCVCKNVWYTHKILNK